MKIAIIEDEKALLDVLTEKFEDAGFEVASLDTGKDALAFLKKSKPDLLLLDLVLPHTSGFEILESMKTDADLQNVPVFVLSNLGEDENLKKALALGAEDYMVKTQHPMGEVLERVKKRLLARSK